MKKIMVVTLLFFSAIFAFADHPATAFSVLKTEDVHRLEMKDGKLSEKDLMTLHNLCISNGYFAGDNCQLYIKAKEYQFRIKARIYTNEKDKKEYIRYSFSLYSQKESKRVFSSEGNILYKKELSIKSDRTKDKFTIVFRWANLKK